MSPDYVDEITFSRVFSVKEGYTSSAWLSTIKNGEYEYWTRHCALQDIKKQNLIVAYEPIWSIGTGKIPQSESLNKTIIHIKKILANIFKNPPPVLYGGSIDASNVKKYKYLKTIDGFLIGGASKSAKNFIDIIKNYYR